MPWPSKAGGTPSQWTAPGGVQAPRHLVMYHQVQLVSVWVAARCPVELLVGLSGWLLHRVCVWVHWWGVQYRGGCVVWWDLAGTGQSQGSAACVSLLALAHLFLSPALSCLMAPPVPSLFCPLCPPCCFEPGARVPSEGGGPSQAPTAMVSPAQPSFADNAAAMLRRLHSQLADMQRHVDFAANSSVARHGESPSSEVWSGCGV